MHAGTEGTKGREGKYNGEGTVVYSVPWYGREMQKAARVQGGNRLKINKVTHTTQCLLYLPSVNVWQNICHTLNTGRSVCVRSVVSQPVCVVSQPDRQIPADDCRTLAHHLSSLCESVLYERELSCC